MDPYLVRRRARKLRVLGLLLCCSSRLQAQVVTPPQLLGPIAGPGSVLTPPGVRFYGTDLGWTFEHKGQLFMLFGDTWPYDGSLCEPLPHNDDSQATIPLTLPSGLPTLAVATDPAAPNEFARIHLLRGAESLVMGYDKTPLTAFSDGTDAIGLFGLVDLVRCRRQRGRSSCRPYESLTCSQKVGVCTPATLGFEAPCDLVTGAGCAFPGEQCTPTTTGICVDPRSSQNDGTSASLPASAAYHTHFGIQDATLPSDYHDAGTLASNKFIDVTARTVRCFSGRTCGSDYTPGHGAVLIWGRPGYDVQPGRQAHMYLLAHRLPIRRNAAGTLQFRPRYFAGVRPGSGDPLWTRIESRAKPLAMDGTVGGNPDDDQPYPNQTAVSWLGAPVNKWMMLYGGGGSGVAGGQSGSAPGSIRVRFADHPWGPWSPSVPHLDPGSPTVLGTPFGPGGFIFNPACHDQLPAVCTPSDAIRPPDFFVPGCAGVGKLFDTGFLYAPNIIDAYTGSDGAGGLNVFWNVSAWNPYLVALLETNVKPSPAAAAAACPSSVAAGVGRAGVRFRWCAAGE